MQIKVKLFVVGIPFTGPVDLVRTILQLNGDTLSTTEADNQDSTQIKSSKKISSKIPPCKCSVIILLPFTNINICYSYVTVYISLDIIVPQLLLSI